MSFEEAAFDRRRFLVSTAALAGSLLLEGCGGSSKNPNKTPTSRKPEQMFASQPDWEQDFATYPDGALSGKHWNFELGTKVPNYNKEAETYTKSPDNVRVENGVLVLEAHRQAKDGRKYTSGRIDTKGKFDFKYGKIEVELQLPAGVGTWPAAWLLPSDEIYDPSDYGIDDPDHEYLINGEIDFMEAVGFMQNTNFPAAHTYDTIAKDEAGIDPPLVKVPDGDKTFHTYGVELLPDMLTFTFDGKPYYSFKKTGDNPKAWPFDQPYYVILNLAMGGGWGGSEKKQYPPLGIDDSQQDKWQMKVRSVKHYPLAK